MNSDKLFFIINPASKSGKGIAIWKEIKPYLQEKGLDFKAYKTTIEKNTTYYVNHIAEKYDEGELKIFILGGDGTINEALQGIPENDFERIIIGYVPTGSSNDLARAIGYGNDSVLTLKKLLESDSYKRLDIGLLKYNKAETLGYTQRRFVVSCGMGYDASVCEETNSSPWKAKLNKLKLGKLSYFAICLKQLFGINRVTAKVTFEGVCDAENDNTDSEISLDKCYFVVAMNHCYQGGGIKFCPDAVSDDGLLDICYANNISRLRVLYTLPFAFSGKHIGMKGIGTKRCKSVRIEYQEPMWVHTDGEVKTEATDITITCQPAKLKFMTM